MRSVEELFDEASEGHLTDTELADVVRLINDPSLRSDDELRDLIFILGKVDLFSPGEPIQPRGIKNRKLVEKFLHYPRDPSVACAALKVLCDYWGLTSDYLDFIKKIMRKETWDASQEIAISALNIAGEYLREHQDRQLLQQLIDLWEKEDLSEVDREIVYTAMARAAGEEWSAITSEETQLQHVLAKIYQRQ